MGLGLHDSEKPSALYRCDELVWLCVSGFGFQVAKVCGTLNPELPLVTSVMSKANGTIPESPKTLDPNPKQKSSSFRFEGDEGFRVAGRVRGLTQDSSGFKVGFRV